jgi:hypothetical protein
MAAEALGFGASVAAFIGLAGQIVSGCQYISNLLDDARDAPKDLRALRNEVETVQGSVSFFQKTLSLLDQDNICDEAKSTLEETASAVKELRELVDEFCTGSRRLGGLKVAFKKQRIEKSVKRLQCAKLSLIALQENASLCEALIGHGNFIG